MTVLTLRVYSLQRKIVRGEEQPKSGSGSATPIPQSEEATNESIPTDPEKQAVGVDDQPPSSTSSTAAEEPDVEEGRRRSTDSEKIES